MRWLLGLTLLVAACGADGNARFLVRESIEQLHVTHAEPGATLALHDANEQVIAEGTVDELGSVMFRRVPPGQGYTIHVQGAAAKERSRHLTVMSLESSKPSVEFYRAQKLAPGFNYLTTRDGTTLSAYVTLPGPVESGPYPTVVNYSGYEPSKPGEPMSQFAFLCDQLPALCDPPNDPNSLVAALYGYATVSVNIRGTGCSGGAYDYFETPQRTDGYDVIETVAAQAWVLHHHVGMVGLSYPGITQLFVAAERPPSLAAIAPQSVIGNTATTLLPGGMLNDGFAIAWVKAVLSKAKPYGQGWERGRVDAGDTVCEENQLLHGQRIDNVEQARMIEFYDPAEHDRFNPTLFVDRIEVPVFLSGSWQDEQTGPFFFTLLNRFTSSPSVHAFVTNGVHVDGFSPAILDEWHAFLELFVAERVPEESALLRSIAPLFFDQVFGASLHFPAHRWAGYADLESARAAWNAEPPIRAFFEGGGVVGSPGAPVATFDRHFSQWPPSETRVERFFLAPLGTLAQTAPSDSSASSSFSFDPGAGARGILAPGGDVWDQLPAYDWRAPVADKAVVFESAPLVGDRVMLGSGSVDLWLRADVDDADLEVTLTEIRPDGQEMYVQSGWLRASHRGLEASSTELWPSPTYLQADHQALTPGEWMQTRVALAAFSHVFRAGSRIRLIIDTPGDNRADWRFALKPFAATTRYAIGHDATHASSLALPVLDGVTAPTPLPACPSLRGQPCRTYVPYLNVAD